MTVTEDCRRLCTHVSEKPAACPNELGSSILWGVGICLHLPSQWRQQAPLNLWYISTKLQDVTSLVLTTLLTSINQYRIVYKQPVHTAQEECSTRPILQMGAAFPFTRKMFPKGFVNWTETMKMFKFYGNRKNILSHWTLYIQSDYFIS
jgi:hypothetical protein